jgi:hypothetical protein
MDAGLFLGYALVKRSLAFGAIHEQPRRTPGSLLRIHFDLHGVLYAKTVLRGRSGASNGRGAVVHPDRVQFLAM